MSFWWTLSPAWAKPWLSHHCCTQGTGGYHSAGLDKSQYKIGTKYRMLQFAILPLLQSQSRDETFFQTQTRTRISQWNLCPSWASRQRLQKSCDTIKKYTSWLDKLSVGRKRPKSNRSLCWQQVCLKRASSPYETLCARRLLPCHFRHIRFKPCSRSLHCKRYQALLLQDIAGSLYLAIGTVVAFVIIRVQCLGCKGSQASCCQLSSANQSPLILINSLSSVRALAFMGWCRAHHSDKNKLARPASDADC